MKRLLLCALMMTATPSFAGSGIARPDCDVLSEAAESLAILRQSGADQSAGIRFERGRFQRLINDRSMMDIYSDRDRADLASVWSANVAGIAAIVYSDPIGKTAKDRGEKIATAKEATFDACIFAFP